MSPGSTLRAASRQSTSAHLSRRDGRRPRVPHRKRLRSFHQQPHRGRDRFEGPRPGRWPGTSSPAGRRDLVRPLPGPRLGPGAARRRTSANLKRQNGMAAGVDRQYHPTPRPRHRHARRGEPPPRSTSASREVAAMSSLSSNPPRPTISPPSSSCAIRPMKAAPSTDPIGSSSA
jgi:hypothetical protein